MLPCLNVVTNSCDSLLWHPQVTACSDISLWHLLVASSCDIRRQHPATHSAATHGRLAYGTSTTPVSSTSTSLRSSLTSPRLRMRSLQFSAASLQTLLILYALPQRSVLALGLPALSVPSSRLSNTFMNFLTIVNAFFHGL